MKVVIRCVAVLAVLVSSYVLATDDIASRIAPVGEVCMAGDPCAKAAAPVAVVATGPRSGKSIYEAHCSLCHASGAAGAPKYADNAAWSPRIAKGKEQLYLNAINGIGGMPAKGLCNDCSDEEIQVAVDYMVTAAQ